MLRLYFQGLSATYSFHTASSASFRIDADTITDASGETIATRDADNWTARDSLYTRIDCDGPVTVTRTGTEERSRTYNQVSIVDGLIQGDDRSIAILTDHGEWLDYKSLKPIAFVVLSVPDV